MTPGVTTDRTPQQGATATSGLSFTGQRARSNNIMVDGFDNNDPTVGAVRATFSQEAVREFQVLTNSYSAEFGKAAGGVVNIVTRSGTNEFRGTAFGYYRDEALNAKDHFERFDPFGNPLDREKAPFRQVQWGGVLGGPGSEGQDVLLRLVRATGRRGQQLRQHRPARGDRAAARTDSPSSSATCRTRSARPTRSARSITSSRRRARSSSARNVGRAMNENIEPFGGLVARSRGAALFRDDLSLAVVAHARVRAGGERGAGAVRAPGLRGRSRSIPGAMDAARPTTSGGPTLELPGVASVGRQRFTPQLRQNDRYQLTETVSLAAGAHSFKAGVDLNYLDNRLAALPAALRRPLHLRGAAGQSRPGSLTADLRACRRSS